MIEIQKTQEMIRSYWFPNHIAELTGEPGLQVLKWHVKGDSTYAVKYILSGRTLVVASDIGDAVFNLTCEATLENLKDFSLSYLMKKLSAHSVERWSLNYTKTLESLDNWYADMKDDMCNDDGEESDNERLVELTEIHQELRSAVLNCSQYDQFESVVFHISDSHSYDWFDAESAEMVSSFGKKLPDEFIAYWLGLQMAIDCLQDGAEEALPELVCV